MPKEQARVWWSDKLRLEVDRLAAVLQTSRSGAIAILVRAALEPEGPEAEAVRALRRRAGSPASGRTRA